VVVHYKILPRMSVHSTFHNLNDLNEIIFYAMHVILQEMCGYAVQNKYIFEHPTCDKKIKKQQLKHSSHYVTLVNILYELI
jgi:hypothetical protein